MTRGQARTQAMSVINLQMSKIVPSQLVPSRAEKETFYKFTHVFSFSDLYGCESGNSHFGTIFFV